jgi:hypothetical protein
MVVLAANFFVFSQAVKMAMKKIMWLNVVKVVKVI